MRRIRGSAALVAAITAAAVALAVPARAAALTTIPLAAASGESAGSSLESAAAKAGETGRTVAMSLIALGFAIAAIVLAFRRDFKEAAGVFAVGLVAVLLATPAGVDVLRSTVASLFGTP